MGFECTRRVRFSETDAAGVMHFSRFFCWMEDAEHDLFRELGIPVLDRREDGSFRGWARRSVECEYLAPLRFNDDVSMKIAISNVGDASIRLEASVHRMNQRDKVLCARGQLTIVYLEGNPAGHFSRLTMPAELRTRIQMNVQCSKRE